MDGDLYDPLTPEEEENEECFFLHKYVPVHLLCFVNIQNLSKPINYNGRSISNGVYAVCHASTIVKPSLTSCNARLIRSLTKDCSYPSRIGGYNRSRNNYAMFYHIIPASELIEPCVCIPDIWPPVKLDKGKNDLDHNADYVIPDALENLLIPPTKQWPRVLINKIKYELKEVRKKEVKLMLDALKEQNVREGLENKTLKALQKKTALKRKATGSNNKGTTRKKSKSEAVKVQVAKNRVVAMTAADESLDEDDDDDEAPIASLKNKK